MNILVAAAAPAAPSTWQYQTPPEKRSAWPVLVAVGTFIALIVLVAQAKAQPLLPGEQLVEHNGSLMRVLADDHNGRLVIVYEIPRPGLGAFGVFPGTVLVEGRWIGRGRFEGLAHVFGCGRAYPYRVEGFIGEGNGLFLEGPAPILTPWCTVAAYVWNENARLSFWPQQEWSALGFAPERRPNGRR